MLKYAEAFQALASDEQAVALEELKAGACAGLDDLGLCSAICALTLADALALPEQGPVDLRQAAQAAQHCRNRFSALGAEVQALVLTALVESGAALGQSEATWFDSEQALARLSQCWSLALGDGLPLDTEELSTLQRAARTALDCRETFALLSPLAGTQVLLALYNSGVIYGQRNPGSQTRYQELARYTQCWSLALGDDLVLPDAGLPDPSQFLRSLPACHRVFSALRVGSQKAVLMALRGAGYAHGQYQGDSLGFERKLARFMQSWSLALGNSLAFPDGRSLSHRSAVQITLDSRNAFLGLHKSVQVEVLKTLFDSGLAFSGRESDRRGLEQGLARLSQCWSLGLGDSLTIPSRGHIDLAELSQNVLKFREAYITLEVEGQEQLLKALVIGGVFFSKLEANLTGEVHKLARYHQCLCLAFGSALLLPERESVDLPKATQAALDCCNAFAAITGEAKGQILQALAGRGFVYGLDKLDRHDSDLSLASYAQCWSLALDNPLALPEKGPVYLGCAAKAALACRKTFGALAINAQAQVLRALLSSGNTYGRQEVNTPGRDLAFARHAQCWCLGLGDSLVLSDRVPVDLQQATQAARQCRQSFGALNVLARQCLIGALIAGASGRQSSPVAATTWSISVGLLPRSQREIEFAQNVRSAFPALSRHNRHSWGAASVWLLRLDALPVMPDRPGQVSTTVMIGSQLLALERGVHHPLRRWLRDLSFDRGRAELSGVVCQQRDWPTRFTELPHFMLALGLAGSDDALPSRAVASTWGADIAELAQRSDWLRCLDADGSARRSYILGVGGSARREHTQFPFDAGRWQLDESEHSRWAAWLITLSEGEPLDDIELEFAGWWQQALYTVEALFTWRRRWLPQEDAEVAWQTSARAVVMAQTDRFVQQVWQQTGASLPAGAQAVALGSPDAAPSNTASNLLLAGLNPAHVGKTDRLLHAQQYWSAQLLPQTDDSAQVWRLLELSRHSLLPAKPGSAKWQDWDQPALDALVAAETRVLNDAQARLDAQAQGRPEPPNCLNADRPVEPFATMAEQWERMGVGLDIPEVAAVVQCLAAHEALAQPWWNPDGGGELLLLQPHQGLQRLAMPAHLNAAHWQTLTQHWQRAAQADGNEGIDESMRNQAFAQAWQSMADLQGVAVALWRWLRAQAGETCTNLIVVWPADKAAWPWQALVETLEPADSGVTLELAVGANALMKSRAAPPIADVPDNTPASGKPPSHAALLSDDLWNSAHPVHVLASRLEASVLPQVLRAQAQRSADAACYVRALQCNGMVHLAAHGVYDEGQPMASHLVLHDPQGVQAEAQQPELAQRRARRRFAPPEQVAEGQAEADTEALVQAQKDRCRLPAWLLAEMNLSQPEVSLSACQALRTGQGDAQAALRGPAGLGAVLSAAGARSVVGSLWICESLGIVVFYERWFAHRQHHDALRALRLARQDLRAMTWADCQRWLEQALQQAQREGVLGAEQQRELIKTAQEALQRSQDDANFTGRVEGPFAHPIDWAGMCLIGNGPARPDAAQRGQEPATATNRWQRLRNAWQQLQQALGLGSARR